MRFLGFWWGEQPPEQTVPRDEFDRVKEEHDRKLEALNDALHAWRDHEPDERRQPDAL
jgi:hypothetical protein